MTDKDKYINQLNDIKIGERITIYTTQNVTSETPVNFV